MRGRRNRALVLCLLAAAWIVAGGCHLIFTYEGRDAGAPGEAGSDACLPIPASQVKGKYAGTWSGVYDCPGSGKWNISGTLNLDMSPVAGGKSFQVSGEMSGVADKVYLIKGPVQGSLGCRALSAKMNRVSVTIFILGFPVAYYMTGELQGTYKADTGAKQGFKDGSWSARELNGSCSASGTWVATAK